MCILLQTQETDQTVLLNTAESGNMEIVKLLIGRGADIDITDKVCALKVQWNPAIKNPYRFETRLFLDQDATPLKSPPPPPQMRGELCL